MSAARTSSPEETYIARVLACLPSAPMLRSQIAMDLRSHIAERLDAGQSIDDVVKQLGDPTTLAESYLSAVPLVSGTFGARALAKLIDMGLVWFLSLPPAAAIVAWFVPMHTVEFGLLSVSISIGIAALGLVVYTIDAEHRTGQTFGKLLMHLRVVRESGARITLGQSIVRQLPAVLQIWSIDVLFALFTDKNQRAFEIISKTRVVTIAP